MFLPNLTKGSAWPIVFAIAFILLQVILAWIPVSPSVRSIHRTASETSPSRVDVPRESHPIYASACSRFVATGTGRLPNSDVDGIELIEEIERLVARGHAAPPDRDHFGWTSWATHRMRGTPPSLRIPARLVVGASWTVGFRHDARVLASERVEVPAGAFNTSLVYYNDRALEHGWRVEAWLWLTRELGVVQFRWRVTTPQGQADDLVIKLAEINEPCSPPAASVDRLPMGPIRLPRGPREVIVSFGHPVISGRIDRQLVRRVLKQHLLQVRYCYEKELVRDTDLHGELTAQFTVAADGWVTESEVVASTVGNEITERCIESKIRTWNFPKPASRISIVRLPIVLDRIGLGAPMDIVGR